MCVKGAGCRVQGLEREVLSEGFRVHDGTSPENAHPSRGFHRAPGIGLLKNPRGGRFFVREVV